MVVPSGSELHPGEAAGTPDLAEVEVAAAVAVAGAEGAVPGDLEGEAVEVAPTSGIVTTPSIMTTTVPDRGAGGARTRVEMTDEIVAMTVGMIGMVGSLEAKEGGGPRTDPAEPTEKTPRLLPRYICV